MKNTIKAQIHTTLSHMERINREDATRLTKSCTVLDYARLVYMGKDGIELWADAFQAALRENEIVRIPPKADPYYIDHSIRIPSNRRIEAEEGAVIKLIDTCKVLMLRNENTKDGTKKPIDSQNPNYNITIFGGRWEESCTGRAGYGASGMYDENRSFHGVSTCMLFNNIEGLTLKNMTFACCGGFAVQCGDAKNMVFENIHFDSCFADGIHINGNCENVIARNIDGQVGDDLVALNMYDWQNSSVNFGPVNNVLCENLTLSAHSPYKAMRIEPGVYYYENGDRVDCSINNLIVKRVRGIKTFKLYYQTPPYPLDAKPEEGGVGSGSNIFFEDIEIELDAPIDKLEEYVNSDPVKGSFAGFEIGADIDSVYLENIKINFNKKKNPMAFLLCIGPKSCIQNDHEIFDPYVSCQLRHLYLENVSVNGRKDNAAEFIHEIDFSGFDGGKGEILNIEANS